MSRKNKSGDIRLRKDFAMREGELVAALKKWAYVSQNRNTCGYVEEREALEDLSFCAFRCMKLLGNKGNTK